MAKFCRYCGKPRNENARFCKYCGASFGAPVQPKQQYGQAMPVKQKDPYKLLKILLVISCLTLLAGGIFTIPDKISAVRNGAVSGDDPLIIENSGRLTDEQKAEYARIDAVSYEEGAAEDEPEGYIHDGYAWYTGDGSGWLGENEKEGGQE